MTIYWTCQECSKSGTTDKAAELHVKDTTHSVLTSTRPPGGAS